MILQKKCWHSDHNTESYIIVSHILYFPSISSTSNPYLQSTVKSNSICNSHRSQTDTIYLMQPTTQQNPQNLPKYPPTHQRSFAYSFPCRKADNLGMHRYTESKLAFVNHQQISKILQQEQMKKLQPFRISTTIHRTKTNPNTETT